MTYCVKCGAQVTEGTTICPQCGAVIPDAFERKEGHQDYSGQSYTYGQSSTYEQSYTYDQNQTFDYDPEYFPQDEVKRNKGMGVVSYLGILVLIPILAGDKTSEYVKQHVNQGFVLFIINAVLEFAERIFEHVVLIGGILSWAANIMDFALFIIMIMGIVSAARGTRKPMPIIGNIRIFK